MNISIPLGKCKSDPALRRLFEAWCAASFEEREAFDWFVQSLCDNDIDRNLMFDNLLASFPDSPHCGGQVVQDDVFLEHRSLDGEVRRSPNLPSKEVEIFSKVLAQYTGSPISRKADLTNA
jgi:hypothetical protein